MKQNLKEINRKNKYPETTTFHYYNANPKHLFVPDCTIRAVCTALGETWEETSRGLTEQAIKDFTVCNDPQNVINYIESKGWCKRSQPRKSDNTKYTGKQFCRKLADEDRVYLAHIGGHHIVCIKEKKVWDTWDSTDGCVGNYWVKIK